jgi:hypothetical protein
MRGKVRPAQLVALEVERLQEIQGLVEQETRVDIVHQKVTTGGPVLQEMRLAAAAVLAA